MGIYSSSDIMHKSQKSDSIQSDISDIFVKMKTIGQTFRNKANLKNESHLDLVKELELQITDIQQQHDENNKSPSTPLKNIDLQKEAEILATKQRKNRQIGFGADIALEIIKESINNQKEEEKKNLFTINSKIPYLEYCSSEPVLRSITNKKYMHSQKKETEKQKQRICDDSVIQNKFIRNNQTEQNQQSRTTPNSPLSLQFEAKSNDVIRTKPNIRIRTKSNPLFYKNMDDENMNDEPFEKKSVFQYVRNKTEDQNEAGLNMDGLTKTQSLFQPDTKRPFSSNPKLSDFSQPMTPSQGMEDMEDMDLYIVYDDFYGKHEMKENRDTLHENDRKKNTLNVVQAKQTEHSTTKSMLGTFLKSVLGNNDRNESLSKSTTNKTKKTRPSSKLAKINSFLKQNGLTMHHQNVNDMNLFKTNSFNQNKVNLFNEKYKIKENDALRCD